MPTHDLFSGIFFWIGSQDSGVDSSWNQKTVTLRAVGVVGGEGGVESGEV